MIAQVFGADRIWARLTSDPEYLFHPAGASSGKGHRISMAGETLNLGGKVELVVTFRAAKIVQTERFLCRFDAEGPRFEVLN